MKTILIEKTKRIVLDYSFDSKAMEAKAAGFKKLETIQVDDEKAQTIDEEIYGRGVILTIDFEGNIKETKTHKNYVIFHTWRAIFEATTDFIEPPFATADDTYHHQTYEMKIMLKYGFKFASVRDLNAFQYVGAPHGNKTLLRAKYSHNEL